LRIGVFHILIVVFLVILFDGWGGEIYLLSSFFNYSNNLVGGNSNGREEIVFLLQCKWKLYPEAEFFGFRGKASEI
jgi:hypothetical protein